MGLIFGSPLLMQDGGQLRTSHLSAAYSDRYSFKIPDTSHKQILIAKVLTGCPWPQQRTLTKPPPKPDAVSSKFRNECFDRVHGRISDSDIYVIYDHEKLYPAYVVTYTS